MLKKLYIKRSLRFDFEIFILQPHGQSPNKDFLDLILEDIPCCPRYLVFYLPLP